MMLGYEKRIQTMEDGSVWAESGPMRLRIWAWVGKVPQPHEARRAAVGSLEVLQEVASQRAVLSKPWQQIQPTAVRGVAEQMLRSVSAVGDADLTPMAAVAGAIADEVADRLADRGMTKVIVDNGGDIAIRLGQGEEVRVGLRPRPGEEEISHLLVLDGLEASWGVATSGLGGRSFTRGMAYAATVLACSASVADAAATSVANATLVPCPQVRQTRAGDLDPESDIAHLPVTVEVTGLPEEIASMGLQKGMKKARELAEAGVIQGAFLLVGSLHGSFGLDHKLRTA